MGNHSIAILHHDGWAFTKEHYAEIGKALDLITNVGVPRGKTREIHINGSKIATFIDTHDSAEGALILCKGSIATHYGKTDSRDGAEALRNEVTMMNEILAPHKLKVVSTKRRY